VQSNTYTEISNRLENIINNATIEVGKSFVKFREHKFNKSNYRLGKIGIDCELLEWWMLFTEKVQVKDTNFKQHGPLAKYWPDYNIGKMRIDNKRINSNWFEVTENFKMAVNKGLVTHVCFYKDDSNKQIELKEGDVVSHQFIGLADAKEVIKAARPGQYSNHVVNISNFFEKKT